MRRIRMEDASVGWGIASDTSEETIAILRTANGGETWREVSPTAINTLPGAFPGPVRAVFLDGDQAWLMIESLLACRWYYRDYRDCSPIFRDDPASLWYTQDGGRTWDLRSMPEWYIDGPVSFQFIDEGHGWIMSEAYVGAGSSRYMFLRTQDGGRNWETLKSDVHGVHEYSIATDFADASTGLMTFAHDSYYILYPYYRWSRDGGVSWGELLAIPAPPDQPDLFDLDHNDAPFCGTYHGHLFSTESAKLVVLCHEPVGFPGQQVAALLYSTSDGGRSWQSQPYPGGRIQFLDAQLGWALGEEIHQTQDGGITWTKMGEVPWEGQFSFVDEFRGWAVVTSHIDSGRIFSLFKTEDGGRTWKEIVPTLAP